MLLAVLQIMKKLLKPKLPSHSIIADFLYLNYYDELEKVFQRM